MKRDFDLSRVRPLQCNA